MTDTDERRITRTIKTWFADRGFGYVRWDGSAIESFLHINALEDRSIKCLDVGQQVSFVVGDDAKTGRERAARVRLLKEPTSATG